MMLHDNGHAWDECPDADSCELIYSFLELVEYSAVEEPPNLLE